MKGYTFIELLIVFSIMSIIGWAGITSFVGFNNTQAIEGTASDIASLTTAARQRAISQIKPSECAASQVLSGYRVTVSIANGTYRSDAVCGSLTVRISEKKLPPQITFDPATSTTVFFRVPNATVDSPAVVTIRGFGKSKAVRIETTGTISIQ